ncbi:hypothetical protein [Planococcus soli]|uniref:hypothetical protein n=1 Tax=Planococcus soli TaxID=2666072 RepID=UPI00115E9F9F|nr:hypothetical protein [Planococcus soli]
MARRSGKKRHDAPEERTIGLKKSGSGRSAPTGVRRSGEAALFAAQSEWVMTRGVGRWSLDNKKSGDSRLAPTSAGSLIDNGVFLPLVIRLKRLEGLAVGVWTIKKSGDSRLVPTSAGSLIDNGVFCHW